MAKAAYPDVPSPSPRAIEAFYKQLVRPDTCYGGIAPHSEVYAVRNVVEAALETTRQFQSLPSISSETSALLNEGTDIKLSFDALTTSLLYDNDSHIDWPNEKRTRLSALLRETKTELQQLHRNLDKHKPTSDVKTNNESFSRAEVIRHDLSRLHHTLRSFNVELSILLPSRISVDLPSISHQTTEHGSSSTALPLSRAEERQLRFVWSSDMENNTQRGLVPQERALAPAVNVNSAQDRINQATALESFVSNHLRHARPPESKVAKPSERMSIGTQSDAVEESDAAVEIPYVSWATRGEASWDPQTISPIGFERYQVVPGPIKTVPRVQVRRNGPLATPNSHQSSISSYGDPRSYHTAPSSIKFGTGPATRGMESYLNNIPESPVASFHDFESGFSEIGGGGYTCCGLSPMTLAALVVHQDFHHKSSLSCELTGDVHGVPSMSIIQKLSQTPMLANKDVNNEYTRLLLEKSLIRTPEEELDWSGRGQHVEFKPSEEPPLTVLGPLGASMTARIDKVRCRRIVLARKSMKTNRNWTLEHAINEVEHLNRLRHAHIVQLVGSYVRHKDFAILLYPAAECNLTEFMTHWSLCPTPSGPPAATEDAIDRKRSLMKFFSCLAHALEFVHRKVTRHADIKPANILIKVNNGEWMQKYHVYLADFGISKSFVTQDQSQTESTDGRTLRYCAPEVYKDLPHGRAADIFSLGCVYSEMITVLAGLDLDTFSDYRRSDSANDYYHAHIAQTRWWLDREVEKALIEELRAGDSTLQVLDSGDLLPAVRDWTTTIKSTMDLTPRLRPTAAQLIPQFASVQCCDAGPEPYVAAPSLID